MRSYLGVAAFAALAVVTAGSAQAALVSYAINAELLQYDGDGPSDDTNRFFGGDPGSPSGVSDVNGWFTFGLDDAGGSNTVTVQLFQGGSEVYNSGSLAFTGGQFDSNKWKVDLDFGLIANGLVLDPANGEFDDFNKLKIEFTGSGLPTAGATGNFDNITNVRDFRSQWTLPGFDKDDYPAGYQCAPNSKDGVPNCNGRITMDFDNISSVPLPAALPLLASALTGLGFLSSRRRKSRTTG